MLCGCVMFNLHNVSGDSGSGREKQRERERKRTTEKEQKRKEASGLGDKVENSLSGGESSKESE